MSALPQQPNDSMPQRHWPAVDYQTNGVLASACLDRELRSSLGLPSNRKQGRLALEKESSLSKAFRARCREAFVKVNGNKEVMAADPRAFHTILDRICKACGTICPPQETIGIWIDAAVPSTGTGQVLSFAEFVDGVYAICPDVVKDFKREEEAIHSDKLKSSAQAYGILHRKQNATALYDSNDEARGYTDSSGRSNGNNLVSSLVMADAGSLVSAIKHDAHNSRRLDARAKTRKSVVGRELEKDRVAEALRVGPGPDNAVRAAREHRDVERARRAYCNGLAQSLGSNLTMVRRHQDKERVGKLRVGLNRAAATEVGQRRNMELNAKILAGAARATEASAKQMGRKLMLEKLEDGARAQHRAFEARAAEVRDTREVLHWTEARSGLIPEDQVLAQRKRNAASHSEWKVAASEDQKRVLAIRHERLEALRPRSKGAHLAAASSTMDGSGLFASDAPDNEFVEQSISLLDLGSEVEPPMNMQAASRTFGLGTAKAHPGFLVGSSRM